MNAPPAAAWHGLNPISNERDPYFEIMQLLKLDLKLCYSISILFIPINVVMYVDILYNTTSVNVFIMFLFLVWNVKEAF